jgi:hypothetical protein
MLEALSALRHLTIRLDRHRNSSNVPQQIMTSNSDGSADCSDPQMRQPRLAQRVNCADRYVQRFSKSIDQHLKIAYAVIARIRKEAAKAGNGMQEERQRAAQLLKTVVDERPTFPDLILQKVVTGAMCWISVGCFGFVIVSRR